MWKPCGRPVLLPGVLCGLCGALGTLGPCATPRCTAGPAPLPLDHRLQVPGAGSEHWLEDHLEDHLEEYLQDRHILECHLGSRLGGVIGLCQIEVQQLKSFPCYGYKPPQPPPPQMDVSVHCLMFILTWASLPWQRVTTTATGAMRPGEKAAWLWRGVLGLPLQDPLRCVENTRTSSGVQACDTTMELGSLNLPGQPTSGI